MITVRDAQQTVLKKIHRLKPEQVDLLGSLGRVVAEPIFAKRDQPPWDNSAMDGFAVSSRDIGKTPVILKVIGEIAAGGLSRGPVKPGEAVRIMTGAPLPEGANAVVRIEDTDPLDGKKVKILRQVISGENVRNRGEDVTSGEMVISEGTLIGPAEVGMMASVGRAWVRVYRRPRVAILATGDELVDPGEQPEPHQIMNSNAYALAAQVTEAGGKPVLLGIARDEHKDLADKLEAGRNTDVILISGGVSVGKYDFVKDVLSQMGVHLSFWKVAMKPGHPLVFGTLQSSSVYGLPGNPVSTMVTFEQFVRPALLKMAGHEAIFRPTIRAVLKEPFHKKDGKTHFVRAQVMKEEEMYFVRALRNQSSGVLSSMVRSNGLIIVSDTVQEISDGEKVLVQLLDKRLHGQAVPGF
jgi:molybdopterin molybdotransferase